MSPAQCWCHLCRSPAGPGRSLTPARCVSEPLQPFPCWAAPWQEAGWHLHFPAGRLSTFLLLSALPVLLWFVVSQYPQRFLSNPSVLVTQVSVAPSFCALQWPGMAGGAGGGRALQQGCAAQGWFCSPCGWVWVISQSVLTCWPCAQLSVSCLSCHHGATCP